MSRRPLARRLFAVCATLALIALAAHPAAAQTALDFSTPLCNVWSRIRTVTGPLALIGIVAGLAATLVGGSDHHGPFRKVIYIAIVLTLISGAPYLISLFPGVTSC